MDLRPRSLIRLDRLGARIQRKAPAFFGDRLAAELRHILDKGAGKDEFMEFADSLQSRLYHRVLSKYRDEPFSELFALKLTNLAVARYHYLNRHAAIASKPYQMTIDTTNACQLACPGCVHTSNEAYAATFDWPRSTMPLPIYETFLRQMGPFSFCSMFYNYGEPLLHKRFPEFVNAAKKYLVFTMTSTNLSMPLADPEGLVSSGLDRMVLSVDGATQDVYERYRRKGQLDLVFENIRKIVAARKKLGSPTPYLIWQFLTFEHNAHQTSEVLRKARELGVNEVFIQRPFDVGLDDPGVRPATVSEEGTHTFVRWDGAWCSTEARSRVQEIAGEVDVLFKKSWTERMYESGGGENEENRPASATCDWLYQNVTIDGASRIMPCCMAPDKNEKHLVWTTFETNGAEVINTPLARLARLAFANRPLYEDATRSLPDRAKPFCAKCTENPRLYGLVHVAGDIRGLDEKAAIPRSLRWALTSW